jgi:hypothetical protein
MVKQQIRDSFLLVNLEIMPMPNPKCNPTILNLVIRAIIMSLSSQASMSFFDVGIFHKLEALLNRPFDLTKKGRASSLVQTRTIT